MSNSLESVALALAAALLWSTAATAFELALRHLEVVSVLFFATATAALTLLLLCAVQGRSPAAAGTGPRGGRMLVHVLLNPIAYYAVLFLAYARLPAQIALCANYTWAALLALFAVPLLRQPLRPATVAALALAYGGLVIVILGGGGLGAAKLDATGLALGIGSAAIWALDWCLAAGDADAGIPYLARKFTLAAVPLAFAWWVLDGTLPPAEAWPAILWIGLFELSLTFALWLAALRRARSAAQVATLIYLAPVLSLLWIGWILGEPVPATTPLGLGAIIAAAVLGSRGGQASTGGAEGSA